MIEAAKRLVYNYDIFFWVLILRSIYLVYWADSRDETNVIENKAARLDPELMPIKHLYSLLDSRGEVYNKNADRKLLARLAKSKVQVEESDPPKQINLNILTIAELKRLLDHRGIMYSSKSSKQDLMITANISGPVTQDAIDHMHRLGEPKPEVVHEFNAFNIDQTLDKYNESTFLIHIIPARRKYAYFNESSWKALRRKLNYMGFKFGELDCDFEKSICLRQKWTTSVLFLYVPGGDRVQFTISEEYDLHVIFRNIQKTLASRIAHIKSWNEFTSSEWAFYKGKTDDVRVRVILFTNMTESPMFLSVLSVKFRDRVNIGLVNMESRNGRAILKKLKQTYWPLCLIVTRQSILTYGGLPGEYFTRQSLDFFLQSLLSDFKIQSSWSKYIFLFAEPIFIVLLILRFVSKNTFVGNRTQQNDDYGDEEESTEENERNKDYENDKQNNNTPPENPPRGNSTPEVDPEAVRLFAEYMRVRHRLSKESST